MSLNTFSAIGRLGGNPEIVMFTTGKQRTKFQLAVNRDYKDENGERPVDWFTVIAWGQGPAHYAQKTNLSKGDEICVTGRIENVSWTDENGQKRTSDIVVAEHMYLTQKKRSKKDAEQTNKATNENGNPIPDYQNEEFKQQQNDLDDLPF